MFSIDVSNGTVVNNPLINDISHFEFNNTNNNLYGLEQDSASNVKNFILINPVTGTYTQLGNSLPESAMFHGYTTINEIDNVFIFLDPPNVLCSINAVNGNIISNPSLNLNANESIINFDFDNTTGVLYGILQDNVLQKYFLVTIDPLTGIFTKIGSGSIFGIGGGTATIDEVNQEYIYMYSDGLGGHEITTLNMLNGNVLYNSTIQQEDSIDNFHNLEFSNSNNKLYSIHWDSDIVLSTSESDYSKHVKVYPNPTYNIITLENIDCELQEIVVYNTLGQNITNSILINEVNSKVIIDFTDLVTGMYYVITKNIANKVYKQ